MKYFFMNKISEAIPIWQLKGFVSLFVITANVFADNSLFADLSLEVHKKYWARIEREHVATGNSGASRINFNLITIV